VEPAAELAGGCQGVAINAPRKAVYATGKHGARLGRFWALLGWPVPCTIARRHQIVLKE